MSVGRFAKTISSAECRASRERPSPRPRSLANCDGLGRRRGGFPLWLCKAERRVAVGKVAWANPH